MSDGTRRNASPAPKSCDTEKYTHPFPSSLDPRRLFSLADSQFSDDVMIEESAAEKLSPGEALIRDNQCKNSSYLNHVVPEEIHESDRANLLLESAEQECEPVKRDILKTSGNRESVVFSINVNQDNLAHVNQDNLAQALELPLDDGNKNSQIGIKRFDDDESCFIGIAREQLNELPELHYHQMESVNQPEENYSVASSYCETDQIQWTFENMAVKFSSEGLELHSEDTEQTKVRQDIMQTQEDVFEELLSKLSEKNHLIDSGLDQNNSAVVDISQEVDPHISDCFLDDALKLSLVNASNTGEQSKPRIEDVLQNTTIEELETPIEKAAKIECEPVKRDILKTSDNRESVVFSINVNQDNLAQALELPLDDGNKNSQIGIKRFDDDESCFIGIAREQLNELSELHYHQMELVNQPEENYSVASSHCETDQIQWTSENMVVKFSSEGLELHSEDTEQTKVRQNIMQTQEDVSEGLLSKLSEKNHLIDSELDQNNSAVVDISQEVDPHVSDCFLDDALKLPLVNASNTGEQSKPLIEDVLQNTSIEELETPIKKAAKHSKQVSCQASKSRRKRYILRSLGHTERVLRSRTRGNATTPKPTNHVSSVRSRRVGKGRKKNKRKKIQVADEFSKIRKCLRYLLHRMTYEQSFIAAYSDEGWKGYSLEKLKPEKELQRAANEIMRRKLKIRDLFKHLDLLCVEGRFSESLFDSEGQIDSEDIFCAKCGSKETSTTDDIILCDGACDRGFHQFCLEPPLLNEDIPPDEEGWLCPGCDCKVDCIDLLNDSQGTKYSLTDSWENVYPEVAAAAAAGHNNDQNFGLPSDDSDDNDFDPDGQGTDDQGGESSSDVSENNSESEKLEASPKDNQYVGLPSDDSDDDDYNPRALDTEENIKSESSSSDFTSDSENLAAILEDDGPSRNENDSVSSTPNVTNFPGVIDKKGSKNGREKHSLEDELSSIVELGHLNGLSPIVSRRHVERLDYKKLHDETYGNVSSDSSDDEDWTDIAAQRKKNCGLLYPAQQNGKSSVVEKEETNGIVFSDSSDDEDRTDIAAERKKNCGLVSPAAQHGKSSGVKKENNVLGKHDAKGSEITPRKNARRTRAVENTNDSLIKTQEGSSKPGSTGGRAKSTFSKLGEAVVQRLHISFKENQYPDKRAKETLAKDLGLNFKQVSKWFDNTRWSTRHPSHVKATANANIDESESALQKGTRMSHSFIKPEPELDTGRRGGTSSSAHLIKSPRAGDVPPCESENTNDGILGSHTTSRREPNSISSRKRKGRSEDMAVDTDASIMQKQKPLAGSSKAHDGQANGHIRTRRQTLIATNTDSAQKSLVEPSKANVDRENHRTRTRRQKLIA